MKQITITLLAVLFSISAYSQRYVLTIELNEIEDLKSGEKKGMYENIKVVHDLDEGSITTIWDDGEIGTLWYSPGSVEVDKRGVMIMKVGDNHNVYLTDDGSHWGIQKGWIMITGDIIRATEVPAE